MADDLSIEDAFSSGWETFKSRSLFFIGLTLLVGMISYLPNLPLFLGFTPVMMVLYVAFLLLTYVVSLGIIHIFLRSIDGGTPDWREVFSKWDLLGAYLAGLVIAGVLFLIPLGAGLGLGALIGGSTSTVFLGGLGYVAALYLGVAVFFYIYRLVDRDVSAWDILDTFRYSWRITQGVRLNVALFFLVAILINIAGLVALLVGIFVTLPVTGLALAHFYRQLERRAA